MKLLRSRAATSVVCAVCWSAPLACSSPAAPTVLLWEAPLTADAGASERVSGGIAMVATTDRTQIGIGVEDAPVATRFEWLVREGTCATEGTRIGPATAFAPIVTSELGRGEAEAVIRRRLNESSRYAGELFLDDGESTARRVACADLLRQ